MKDSIIKPKLLVVLGPTSSGKSDLAVEIAKIFNGEVVSADSRQVYRGMDIGSGKITVKEMCGVPHHLLNVANPKRTYSVSQFKRTAEKAMHDIHARGKLPILCGGTGFYIQAVVDGLLLPEVKPNPLLRKKLEALPTEKLFEHLEELDPIRAKSIDPRNPRRLVRAIEIATALGSVPITQKNGTYDVLQIGILTEDADLKQRIHDRMVKRMRRGMIREVERLHESGVSWKRLESFGLEYDYIARYLQKKISKHDMLTELETATWQYVKRQRTWFKKDTRIVWIQRTDADTISQIIQKFLG